MNKDKALDLALEALEHMLEDAKQERLTVEYWNECVDAITAIKQARALDKKAENARELGLDYEPVQEPVAWRTFDGEGGYDYRTYEMNEGYAKEWNERNPKHKGWVEPLYTTPPAQPAPAQEPVKLRRGDVLRCIETDELCTVWATSTTHKTLVKWGGNDFSDYTAEQIGELFWLEPESSDVEIAAEQSDNYAAFHAGVRFARAHSFTTPKQEEVEIDWPDYHEQGMGCGLEDRGITDRYEAMRYGWDEALDKAVESVNLLGPLYTIPPAAPVQEPVAWMLPGTDSFLTAASKTHHGVRAESYTTPLYTTPPAAPVPDYAWPTVADYEKDVGFEVNEAFKMAWVMARTTNDLFTQMGKNT
jgi:hypothetical protein